MCPLVRLIGIYQWQTAVLDKQTNISIHLFGKPAMTLDSLDSVLVH